MSYEIHITLNPKYGHQAYTAIKRDEMESGVVWKASRIAGDPLLGPDVFFYLTTHMPSRWEARKRLAQMVERLDSMGVPVMRQKIEHVVLDTKTGVDLMQDEALLIGAVRDILNGVDKGEGKANEPWESIRRRLLQWRSTLEMCQTILAKHNELHENHSGFIEYEESGLLDQNNEALFQLGQALRIG